MVTVIVGVKTTDGVCHVQTLAEDVSEPKYVLFNLPSNDTPLLPGSPPWANYVKGVVACYKGKNIQLRNTFTSIARFFCML